MNEYELIPKVLPARSEIGYIQQIPKIIWQTMKTNKVPPFMKAYADSWINLNPEYEYRFCDDDTVIEFLKNDFPEYCEGYQKIKHGASKADLWRYLIVYKYGGVYADMDCRCVNSLRNWIDPSARFVTQLGTNKDICQWLIISVPENPIFLKAAQKTLHNIENYKSSASHYGFNLINKKLSISNTTPLLKFNHEVLGLSGPPVLQEAAEIVFNDNDLAEIFNDTQCVCISHSTSCQMDGNVQHDTRHEEYLQALSKLKLHHYNGLLSKIKRKLKSMFRR